MAELPHLGWPYSLDVLLEEEDARTDAVDMSEGELLLDESLPAPEIELHALDADGGVASSGHSRLDELHALLRLYAELRARQETGADSLCGRGVSRRMGMSTAAALAILTMRYSMSRHGCL
jgi:hypothetical protein